MAKAGSICCAWRNRSAAAAYSKLWSCARPERKLSCAAGEPEFSKETAPSAACWANTSADHSRTAPASVAHAVRMRPTIQRSPATEGDEWQRALSRCASSPQTSNFRLQTSLRLLRTDREKVDDLVD